MEQPEFDIQTLDKPFLYSYDQKQRACMFAMEMWRATGESDRRQFVLCEPPALKERA